MPKPKQIGKTFRREIFSRSEAFDSDDFHSASEVVWTDEDINVVHGARAPELAINLVQRSPFQEEKRNPLFFEVAEGRQYRRKELLVLRPRVT